MKKISVGQWNEFSIGKLFAISKPESRVLTNYDDGSVPFVASGSESNGVQKYCQPKKDETLDKANCITVSPVDGFSTFQPVDFLGRGGAGSSIHILRNEHLNRNISLFICAVLRQQLKKYSYNNMLSARTLKNEKIKLPATPDGQPDWVYMEQYIKQQEEMVSCFLNTLKHNVLYREEHRVEYPCEKKFCVGELFAIRNGMGITKEEIHLHPGSLPAIQSGEENNGCLGTIDENYCVNKGYTISNGACLTVARSGSSGFVAYHSSKCVAGDSAKILEPISPTNKYVMLFLRASLMVNKRKYAYNDKVTTKGYLQDFIVLPATPDGIPDWNYMEGYMKSIEQKAKETLYGLTH